MPRAQVSGEVEVLRFFEEAPLEKAEMLFNIVKDKMRSRMGANREANGAQKRKAHHVVPDPEPKNTETGTV